MSLFAGIASIAGPLIGGLLGMKGQESANDANRDIAREANQFSERMSSTAHQRQVTDLRAAGLNPILSANAGASAPSGQQATMQNTMDGLKTGSQDAVSNALALAQYKMGMERTGAEIGLMNAQKNKANVEANVAAKGIPQSELMNDVFDVARPYVKKLKESLQSNPSRPQYSPATKQKGTDMFRKFQGMP